MADLTRLFGGVPFVPPIETHDPPTRQLRDAIRAAGLNPPDEVILDGRLRRFRGAGGKKQTSWYVAHGDGVPAGRFGDWKSGLDHGWRADVGRPLSGAEEMALAQSMAAARAARDAEIAARQARAADAVGVIWEAAAEANVEHPYLVSKGVGTHGARVTGDGRLMLPLYSELGDLISLQYVAPGDGESVKRYHPGGRTHGGFTILGSTVGATHLYLAEGWATAATITEATGEPCAVAYSASALVPVTEILRRVLYHLPLTIVADNDRSGTGLRYAEQAAAKHGARYVMPPKADPDASVDANDFATAGGDLRELLAPPKSGWLIRAEDFAKQPAPLSWLIRGWLPKGSLAMLHGASGVGKTFVVLDWCCRVASGSADWCGERVTGGTVAYLAGEGHHGLRGRLAAWMTAHGTTPDLWLSPEGCDLDTPEGYCRVRDAIRAMPDAPALIVVDTLHRFLSGDENSAQDARKMIDACGGLQREFGATVLLVHHTGVSDEAQARARGSSAWRGALDCEINVSKSGDTIRARVLKQKDAEAPSDHHLRLTATEIPGWVTDDGAPYSSAVAEPAPPPPPKEPRNPHAEAARTLERAWWATGAELDEQERPTISRAALAHWLESEGMSAAMAKNATRPDTGKLIHPLLNADVIEKHGHGWSVRNAAMAAQWVLSKKS